MSDLFAISRLDGRSDAQVIIDLVKPHAPGRIFTYSELGAMLDEKTEKKYGVVETRAAVLRANPRLLREEKRVLRNIRKIGYKLAEAKEHAPLALDRRRRADMQLKRGLAMLRNVRLEEMDENSRTFHLGHLMITEAICAQIHALAKRQGARDEAIENLQKRLEAVEQRQNN